MWWISRRAHEEIIAAHNREAAALRDEMVRLRDQVDRMLDHHIRVERREIGLPEVQPTIKPPEEELPERVVKIVSLYADSRTRTSLVHSIRAARRMDPPKSWEQIIGELTAAIPPDALRVLDQPPPMPAES
jgi:hypothetical protein